MALQVSYPTHVNGSSPTPGGAPPPAGSPQRLALDNLLRRELRVGDPDDPQQIAQALLARYKSDPRAIAIAQEARGLPFLHTTPVEARMTQAPTSSDAELQQAINDVERDLEELTTNNLLKDVSPELQGWGSAVRTAITEGATAARFALDPRQRDKAFAIRRQLGDYARMARLVGALTPTMSPTYRKFAQSLDEVAAVLLVLMGEALANVGFSGGHFLMQVPYSELQARRDTVINTLRNLVGSAQQTYDWNNDWPRGQNAYLQLYKQLEDQGQGDLRALLVENELARTMDELIQRAAQGRAEGLRALGATAQLDLLRFRRLVAVGQNVVKPDSPPLINFLLALQGFTNAFDTGGGARLLRIARPPILFYGLYGIGKPTTAEETLLDLVIQRGRLAEALDCFLLCQCGPEHVQCQVILDKVLYDVDRAIDLYTLGKEDGNNKPQAQDRAAAYSYVIQGVLSPGDGYGQPCVAKQSSLYNILTAIHDHLLKPTSPNRSPNRSPDRQLMQQELCIQQDAESRWISLVKTMAPDCVGIDDIFKAIQNLLQGAITKVGVGQCKPIDITLPRNFEEAGETFAHVIDILQPFFDKLDGKTTTEIAGRIKEIIEQVLQGSSSPRGPVVLP